MLCISLHVHELPQLLEQQLRNFKKFIPNSYVIIHLGFGACRIHGELESVCSKFEGVFVNPIHYPTQWGWFLHTHIANFEYAKQLGLQFSHFLTENAQSLVIKEGLQSYIERYDFLSNNIDRENIQAIQNKGAWWVADRAVEVDTRFLHLCEQEKISRLVITHHEGTAYRYELFEEIARLIKFYCPFDLREPRYPTEELYLSTISHHLSKSYSNPWVFMGRFTPGYPVHETQLDLMRIIQSASLKDDFSRSFLATYYGLKCMRDLNNPVRAYLREQR